MQLGTGLEDKGAVAVKSLIALQPGDPLLNGGYLVARCALGPVVSHQSSPSTLTRLFIKCRAPLKRFTSAPVTPCGATVRGRSLSTR